MSVTRIGNGWLWEVDVNDPTWVPPNDEFIEARGTLHKRGEGNVNGPGVKVNKRRKIKKAWRRAARQQAAAQDVPWSSLTKAQRTTAALVEGVALGSKRALRKLCKRLNIPLPTSAAIPAPAAAPAPSVDPALAKAVLGTNGAAPIGGPRPEMDAREVARELRKALSSPHPGPGGWRP